MIINSIIIYMNKIFNLSATNSVFIILSTGLVYLTIIKIIDPKDFIALTGMAFTAKFLRNKPQV